jgi:hypothetical protein
VVGDFKVKIDKYVTDYIITTEYIEYTDQGIGVYRIPITVDALYDSFCITIETVYAAEIPGVESGITLPPLADAENVSGSGTQWVLGASPEVTLSATSPLQNAKSKFLEQLYSFVQDNTYVLRFGYSYNNDPQALFETLTFYLLDASNNILYSESVTPSGVGSGTFEITFVAPASATKYRFQYSFINGTGSNSAYIALTDDTSTTETPTIPAIVGAQITEEICIDIIESCEAAGGFIPTDIRLLEDGSYRLLE